MARPVSGCKLLAAPRHIRLARERPESEAYLKQAAMGSEARGWDGDGYRTGANL